MRSDARIVFDHVWKKFHRGESHDSLRELIPAVARRLIGRGERPVELETGDFWAVKDLSFEVLPGQTLGIIGPNGSGKSTTLRILTRILGPSRGRVDVQGRMGALVEISAGFHGDLTGRENVFLQGAIMGMRRNEIEERFDDIVDFSGISEFIDTPVKRYSSGMNARLGFSIAAYLEPDVLIIDEVLAVGDLAFQDQAFGRIKDLAASGRPVVIVSHQLERVAELCTEAILLRRGEVVFRGNPTETIAAYVQGLSIGTPGEVRTHGVDLVRFDGVRLANDRPVVSGEYLRVEVDMTVLESLPDHVEPLQIRLRNMVTGRTLYLSGSRLLDVDVARAGRYQVTLDLQVNCAPGEFLLELSARDDRENRDVAESRSTVVHVGNSRRFQGPMAMNPRVQVASLG